MHGGRAERGASSGWQRVELDGCCIGVLRLRAHRMQTIVRAKCAWHSVCCIPSCYRGHDVRAAYTSFRMFVVYAMDPV